VRVLLDSFFDDAKSLRSNRATAAYLNAPAANEGLDVQAATGNPTGGGIHMKLVLVKADGETWTALGSLNGGEVSHKLNREVLLVDHLAVYNRLAAVFRGSGKARPDSRLHVLQWAEERRWHENSMTQRMTQYVLAPTTF
jgi:hypothetical protein